MPITLYHNPRCSKSRQTLELLQQHGITPELVLYLQTPPSAQTLQQLIGMLGIAPTGLIRFNEERAHELQLQATDKRSVQEWATLLAENPVLIERPIAVHGNKALICRPPERVLELLSIKNG